MKCGRCGAENNPGSPFCGTCGGQLNNVQPTNNVQPMNNMQQNVQPMNNMQQNYQPMNNMQQGYNYGQVNNKPKKNKTGCIIALAVGIPFLIAFILVIVTILFTVSSVLNETEKLVCESTDSYGDVSSIVITYNIKGIKEYEASYIDFNLDEENAKVEEMGISKYVIEYNKSFRKKYGTTCQIEKSDGTYEKVDRTYEAGEPVTLLDGSKWHILKNEDDTLTLLADTLAVDSTGYGTTGTPDAQKWENSYVKEYMEKTFVPNLNSSLIAAGGTGNVTGRLISKSELEEYTTFENEYSNACYHTLYSPSNSKSILMDDEGYFYSKYSINDLSDEEIYLAMFALTDDYWTMTNLEENTTCEQVKYIKYAGAYYVRTNNYLGYATVDLAPDMEAAYSRSTGKLVGTSTTKGIRPLIVTTMDNVLKES